MAEYVLIFLALMIVSVGLYSLYSRYINVTPQGPSDQYLEALRDLLDGNEETAFGKLRQVVSEDSENVDAYLRLGQILRNHNKPQQALQVHKDLALRKGLSVEHKVGILKQIYFDNIALDNADTAEAALREIVSLESQNLWAFQCLLEVQKNGGKWDEAYDTATSILKLESNKSKKPLALFKFHKAEHSEGRRDYHKARVLYKEALGLDPGFVAAYLAIGDSYIAEDRIEDAVNFWKKLIGAVPEQGAQAIERLKKSLFDLGRFGDIVDICENILKHSPRDIEARFTLAEFYEKKGDLEMSEELLTQLVEDNPENLKSIIGLIRVYLDRNDRRKMESLFRTLEQKWDRAHRSAGVEAGVTGA